MTKNTEWFIGSAVYMKKGQLLHARHDYNGAHCFGVMSLNASNNDICSVYSNCLLYILMRQKHNKSKVLIMSNTKQITLLSVSAILFKDLIKKLFNPHLVCTNSIMLPFSYSRFMIEQDDWRLMCFLVFKSDLWGSHIYAIWHHFPLAIYFK